MSGDGEQPRPQPSRGLVVLPAAVVAEERVAGASSGAARHRPPVLGRWTVLIATLLVGAVIVLLIALLWPNGSGNPNPRSLPPVTGSMLP